MKGKFKKGEFFIGDKENMDSYNFEGKWAEISETEYHHIFGKRYKIVGRDEWFESNCFECIIGDSPHN